VPSERYQATPSAARKVTGGQGVRRLNLAAPTGNRVFSNIVTPLQEPTREPSCCAMAPLEACANRVPWRPYRASATTRQSRLRPTVKDSKIAEAPQICTAAPTTANRSAPSRRHGLTASGHSSHCSNCRTRGKPGRLSEACPRRLGRDGRWHERNVFGRAATTVAIFTDLRETGSILTMAKVPSVSAATSMRRMSPRLFEPNGVANFFP